MLCISRNPWLRNPSLLELIGLSFPSTATLAPLPLGALGLLAAFFLGSAKGGWNAIRSCGEGIGMGAERLGHGE